ncbi:MAG TPA: hypothetical protein VJO16_02560 [Candidatus Acidoferrum sp.]|nr:hypothetical protein [Candidatus Acidoferrum sp.]
MRKRLSTASLILGAFSVVPAVLALPQVAQETRNVIVNGHRGQVSLVQLNGRSYVDVEGLARIANGSLGFDGNQITLTLPGAAASAQPSAPSSTSPPSDPGFSKGFLKASIEAMSLVREWHSALANAIRNGFPISEAWLAGYRGQATAGLRLASVSVSTDSDRKAFQLFRTGFDMMNRLSNQYVAARQSLDYIAPDALANDPLDQKILNCGHSVVSMIASGEFVDDGSCQ